MKCDGHIHTPYCPHGSNDSWEEYIEQAIIQNFTEITFTEHAPLPMGFKDPTPEMDSAMKVDHLEDYINHLQILKRKYTKKLKINIGLEVDYIIGFENETKKFLNQYGPYLDDSILSVHFLKKDERYFCLDYSLEEFNNMIHHFGSIEEIYHGYYSTLKHSITADLGTFKPHRIGHITLVHKFQKQYPCVHSYENMINEILDLIQIKNLQIDYNGAGIVKPFCQETYPPSWVVKKAMNKGIPLVYGSDAHSASGIGQGYAQLVPDAILVSPTLY